MIKNISLENWLTIVLLVGGMLFNAGYTYSRFVTLNEEVTNAKASIEKLDAEGSEYAKELKWQVVADIKDIENLKVDSKKFADAISEMKSDLRVIAEWVRRQDSLKGTGYDRSGEIKQKTDSTAAYR